MTIVAKTVLTYNTVLDFNTAMMYMPWRDFLPSVGQSIDDSSVVDGAVITRFWTDKSRAQEYMDWISAELVKIEITPVSFVLEDYTEPV